MKKINRKYLFDSECSNNILEFAEDRKYFLNKSLDIKVFEDATLLPPAFISWISSPWAKGGAVDENNDYIIGSASRCLTNVSYIKKDDSTLYRLFDAYPIKELEYCNESVFYGGPFIKQWGHFLLEFITRLWAIVQDPEKYKDMKVVFLPMRDYDEIDGTFLELLNLIGIRKEQILLLRKPTKFRSVIIPDECVCASWFWTKEYKSLINHVISKAMEKNVKIKTYKKIYLSRKNWALSYDRDIGEDKIERFFNQNGFKSLSMEKYSLVEQIHILQGAEHVSSAICTLPHNLIFARDGIKSTIINKIPKYGIMQFLVDDMKKLEVTYIDSYLALFPVGYGDGPFLFDINKNLISYAKDNGMKLPKREARKDDIIKYLDLCFEKIEDFTDEELFEFRNLYKIMRTRFHFYSKRELIFKKYFHKIMWKLSLGKKNFHLEKYIKYKMKLNKMKEMYYQ